jgi:hypothetical protein
MKQEQLQNEFALIIKEQMSLEQNEQFKMFIEQQKQISQKLADFKLKAKEAMIEQGIKSIISPNGKDDWSMTLSIRKSAKVDDASLVPEEFKTLEQVDTKDLKVIDGVIYREIPNLKKFKVLVDSGDVKENEVAGLSMKSTPAFSLKVNGKAI